MEHVQTWKVRVVNGRLVSDETGLPEGTEFEVQPVEKKADDLTPEQAAELRRSWESGRGTAAELVARLRR